jgi:hypothetical protein
MFHSTGRALPAAGLLNLDPAPQRPFESALAPELVGLTARSCRIEAVLALHFTSLTTLSRSPSPSQHSLTIISMVTSTAQHSKLDYTVAKSSHLALRQHCMACFHTTQHDKAQSHPPPPLATSATTTLKRAHRLQHCHRHIQQHLKHAALVAIYNTTVQPACSSLRFLQLPE